MYLFIPPHPSSSFAVSWSLLLQVVTRRFPSHLIGPLFFFSTFSDLVSCNFSFSPHHCSLHMYIEHTLTRYLAFVFISHLPAHELTFVRFLELSSTCLVLFVVTKHRPEKTPPVKPNVLPAHNLALLTTALLVARLRLEMVCMFQRHPEAELTQTQAAQATFKSIKAVMPLLDRVLVQRFKAETVRVAFFRTRIASLSTSFAENCHGDFLAHVSDKQSSSRGHRHRRWPWHTG